MTAKQRTTTEELEFWQRESTRHMMASAQFGSRVYLILSFGVASVAAVTWGGLAVKSALMMTAAPIVALFMLGLIVRATIEALYWASYQRLADFKIAEGLRPEVDYPVWRAQGGEPPRLEQFNAIAWIVGLTTLVFFAFGVDVAALLLAPEFKTGPLELTIARVAALIAAVYAIAIGVAAGRAIKEARSFDPTKAPPKWFSAPTA